MPLFLETPVSPEPSEADLPASVIPAPASISTFTNDFSATEFHCSSATNGDNIEPHQDIALASSLVQLVPDALGFQPTVTEGGLHLLTLTYWHLYSYCGYFVVLIVIIYLIL